MGFVKDIVDGIYNLLLGLKVTAERLPEKAVTLQYPDEKHPMPERSRGVVVLLSDKETGELNCTACMLCQKACPTAAITIEREKNEQKRWYPKSFTIDNTICCFCGLCEDACNFVAIKMTGKYEMSVYDQGELVYDMKKLQELGRDVEYTPKPKKKPAPKPAPKTAESGDAKKAEPAADVATETKKSEPAPETKNEKPDATDSKDSVDSGSQDKTDDKQSEAS